MAEEDLLQPTRSYEGLLARSTGLWHDVVVGGKTVPCRIPGRFRLGDDGTTHPMAAGDRVSIVMQEDGTGVIQEIHERQNRLSRRAAGRRVGMEHVIAANIDRAWLIQSVRMPKINTGLIDRFLVMAESNDVPPGIVLNKADLMKKADEEAVSTIRTLYETIGYPVIWTSAETGEGVGTWREALQGKVNVLAGPSGVGKSTLLNRVEPALDLSVANVSDRTRKGRHTTTFAALYPLSFGGAVIDTPGIREFGIIDLEPHDLGFYFIEFRPFLPDCRFPNCTHDHEPGCAVQAAVEEELISDIRYYSYLNILSSVRLGEKDVGR